MTSVVSDRRRLTNTVKDSMRDLSAQLTLLNQQVSAGLDLREGDLGCLNLISRHGPLSPTALARLSRLHPATMTGVLDRLERAGWITRDRDPADRRAVLVSARKDRSAEVFARYSGMNASMDAVCEGFTGPGTAGHRGVPDPGARGGSGGGGGAGRVAPVRPARRPGPAPATPTRPGGGATPATRGPRRCAARHTRPARRPRRSRPATSGCRWPRRPRW